MHATWRGRGFATLVMASAGLVACGGGAASPVLDGGIIDYATCKPTATVLTAADASAMGFDVAGDLQILAQTTDVTFHHGEWSCSDPHGQTDDGNLHIEPRLAAVLLVTQEPTFAGTDPSACPAYVSYAVSMNLTADDGTIAGAFTGQAVHWTDGIYFTGSAPAQDLRGLLGVRANLSRARTATVWSTVTLTSAGPTGSLLASTDYTDGRDPPQDQGDGMFWPSSSGDFGCGWLEAPQSPGSTMITLDAYRGL